MTNDKIIELAKAAGFSERYGIIRVMHSSGRWVGINGEIEAYTEAVIKQYTEELLKDAGEPVRHEFDRDGKWAAYYTAEQVAASVAQAYKQGKHDEEIAQGPSEFEGWERDRLLKRITELENALQRIDTVAVFLPTFKVIHEGEVEAATRNVVEAIDSATKRITALESTLRVAIGGMESVEPAIAVGYGLTRVRLLELIEKCKEVVLHG